MAYSSKVHRQIEAFAAPRGYVLHRMGKGYWSLDPADAGQYDLTDERSFPVCMGKLHEVWNWVQQQEGVHV
jgi:hypothetical protein